MKTTNLYHSPQVRTLECPVSSCILAFSTVVGLPEIINSDEYQDFFNN